MGAEVWILGGTGRSGCGIAAELVRRGVSPVLVGRDPAQLADASARAAGGGRTVAAASPRGDGRLNPPSKPTVVINTIGPFLATAARIVEACLPSSHYIDLANDVAALLAVLDLHEAATVAGRTVVTGAGFGVTATESVVVTLREGRPAPHHVRVDAVPSLALEAGLIGEALAATILDGLPDVEGGRRYHKDVATRAVASSARASVATSHTSRCRTDHRSPPRACRWASWSRRSEPVARPPWSPPRVKRRARLPWSH